MNTTPATWATTATEHDWGPGAWWPVFPLAWALFWAAVVTTVIVLLRRRGATRSGQDVLAARFARGEIDETEYAQRLDVLRRRGRARGPSTG
ncbi:MAG: SHOCT domain-containing protein [Actinomycetes bacterium]